MTRAGIKRKYAEAIAKYNAAQWLLIFVLQLISNIVYRQKEIYGVKDIWDVK